MEDDNLSDGHLKKRETFFPIWRKFPGQLKSILFLTVGEPNKIWTRIQTGEGFSARQLAPIAQQRAFIRFVCYPIQHELAQRRYYASAT